MSGGGGTNNGRIFVATTAKKVYELDTRYSQGIVTVYTPSGFGETISSHKNDLVYCAPSLSSSGSGGSRVGSATTNIDVFFGVCGGHYVQGLNAYVPPSERQFASVALEVSEGPFDSSDARNFMFPLVDVGDGVFNVGLGVQKAPNVCGKDSWFVDSNLILF